MTVAELVAELAKLPQEALVVMAKDAEGNDYSPYSDNNLGWYAAETTYSGEFHTEPDPEDLEEGEEPWDYASDRDFVRAVCLWPTN
jgi:hypothetical protein